MISYSHETAPTEFVEVNRIQFAYRRLGSGGGVPLVFLQYFSGTMDNWDPAITNGFAADREVILFDNAGVGNSGGETPSSVGAMTRDCADFLWALGLEKIDLLGFSLGGMIAQQLSQDRPDLVRRIILSGTGPRGGEGMTFTALSGGEIRDEDSLLLAAFFCPTASSQAAGRSFLQRLKRRKEDRDQPVSTKSATAQLSAIREWGRVPSSDRYGTLKNIRHETLVVHGNTDQVVSPINSLILAQRLPDAQLIVYPDSAHGAQYQHADLFLKHASIFLKD